MFKANLDTTEGNLRECNNCYYLLVAESLKKPNQKFEPDTK